MAQSIEHRRTRSARLAAAAEAAWLGQSLRSCFTTPADAPRLPGDIAACVNRLDAIR